MAKALNVGPPAISNAIQKGAFPPSWFVAMQPLCEAAGVECSPSAFNMRETAHTPPATACQPVPASEPSLSDRDTAAGGASASSAGFSGEGE